MVAVVTTYVSRHEAFPKYAGVCAHCSQVFGVRDAGGLEDNGNGIILLARCPGCFGMVGMIDRFPAPKET